MTDTVLLLLSLAGTFFVIGLFTFGGGYAMLSLIQAQVVTAHGYLTESAFTDIVAISQMTPGPIGINTATYVGYEVLASSTGSHLLGILGSATATLAITLPSFAVMLLVVKFYTKFRRNRLFEGVMAGIRPTVVGLIAAAAVVLVVSTSWNGAVPSFSIVRENIIDWKSWIILGAAFAASFGFKVNPILLIIASAVLGLALY